MERESVSMNIRSIDHNTGNRAVNSYAESTKILDSRGKDLQIP